MAFEPKTWKCGDTISAEELNRMEEGIQEALECCEDKGFECVVVETELYDGSVASTQSYNGAYRSDVIIQQDVLQADAIKVAFNGVEYQADKGEFYNFAYYGAPFQGGFSPSSFSQYPFSVYSDGNGFRVATLQSSTNEITVSTVETTIDTSECFEQSVKQFVPKNVKDAGANSVVECDVESNQASGNYSHAEGEGTTASDVCSHAEGRNTTASGGCSHAEGEGTTASNYDSHAEGSNTTASGGCSHAEGEGTTASGNYSHAEGKDTTASGYNSHADGRNTIASHASQHVFGEYNIEDPSTTPANARGNYIEIVGNGTSMSKSNARTLDWSGNEVLQGSLTLGKGTADETTITATQLKALLALLNA